MLFITKYNYDDERLIFISHIYTCLLENEYLSIDVSKNYYIKNNYSLNISVALYKEFPDLFNLAGSYEASEILDAYIKAIKILKDNGCTVSFNDDILVFK